MKKIFFFIVYFVLGNCFSSPFGGGREGAVFAQSVPLDCPQIIFSYDASGNRMQRKLVITPCDQQSNKLAQQPQPTPPFHVNVYPNPAQDKINVDLQKDELETESKIELYDVNGKVVYTENSLSLQIQVDISGYPSGIYLLKITKNKEFTSFNVSKY